jgi:hypothetical protein
MHTPTPKMTATEIACWHSITAAMGEFLKYPFCGMRSERGYLVDALHWLQYWRTGGR